MQKIINAMSDFGLTVDDPTIDGEIHRCRSNAKEKRNKDGWYLLHRHGEHLYAVFGCWIRGEKSKASTRGLNGDIAGADRAWKILEERRSAAEMERRKKAIATASNFIEKHTTDPDPEHGYLVSKGVGIFGNIRQANMALILPVVSPSGEITSYQTISSSGRKRFLYHGVVAGGCFPIPGDDAVTVCVCEGYATGATIRQATGFKVLVAFNAGNLVSVAKTAVKQFPDREVLICADNDHGTERRIGKNPGIEAAKKTGLKYVYPTGIKGTDFNDMASEFGIDAVKQEIFSRHTVECLGQDDCYEMDESLKIPSDLPMPGLIGQGLEALEGDIIQYSLPLVLTVISRAIAGKISINGVWPNVFNIKVGGTSTGKTATDKKFMSCLNIDGFVSMNDVASGPGIWRAVSENPHGMGLFDEVSGLFLRYNSKSNLDMIAEQKSNALCDLFTRSGQTFCKRYGDVKNTIQIDYPCVSIIGNATPTIFEAIQLRDFETGLLQRFDFWYYGGKIKSKALIIGSKYREKTIEWINELREIMGKRPKKETIATAICQNIEMTATDDAMAMIKDYSEYVVSEANKAESEGAIGFVSRRFDLALKYALIHHAAIFRAERLYNPVALSDIEFGIAIAEMLSQWKVDVLVEKVVSGNFHNDCETFKKAILLATKAGRNATYRYMATRKKALKNWQPKYAESIIEVLKKRGEIITKEGRDGTTVYYLPKKKEFLRKFDVILTDKER